MALEKEIFDVIFSLAHQSKILDWFLVFFADYLAYALVLGFLITLFRSKDWKDKFYQFAFIALSVILSRFLITEIIRFAYFRLRPFAALEIEPLIDYPSVAAFPSGHAAFFFAMAFAIFFINRKLGIWYISGAVLMGLARVAVGVHWPLDIVGGALVALLSVIVVRWILNRTLKSQ